jgi:hypothetical protein
MKEKVLREYLAKVLTWGEAHADWKKALARMEFAKTGIRAPGLPHSAWELLEHARIAQWDILEFSRNAKHKSPDWPSGYWPSSAGPASQTHWNDSAERFLKDMKAMARLVENPKTDLFKKIPHGSGQTILRQLLLLADHNAYHLGQFVLVRRAVGAWEEN